MLGVPSDALAARLGERRFHLLHGLRILGEGLATNHQLVRIEQVTQQRDRLTQQGFLIYSIKPRSEAAALRARLRISGERSQTKASCSKSRSV